MKEALMRWYWYLHYLDCHRIAFKIATMGQGDDNGEAQPHLDNAKDELYRAARLFKEWSK
jgi:hypothetical protein